MGYFHFLKLPAYSGVKRRHAPTGLHKNRGIFNLCIGRLTTLTCSKCKVRVNQASGDVSFRFPANCGHGTADGSRLRWPHSARVDLATPTSHAQGQEGRGLPCRPPGQLATPLPGSQPKTPQTSGRAAGCPELGVHASTCSARDGGLCATKVV